MDELSKMLMDSAHLVHESIMNPSKRTMEETKIIIAGANTLAQTGKTYIQNELLKKGLHSSKTNVSQTIHKLSYED